MTQSASACVSHLCWSDQGFLSLQHCPSLRKTTLIGSSAQRITAREEKQKSFRYLNGTFKEHTWKTIWKILQYLHSYVAGGRWATGVRMVDCVHSPGSSTFLCWMTNTDYCHLLVWRLNCLHTATEPVLAWFLEDRCLSLVYVYVAF